MSEPGAVFITFIVLGSATVSIRAIVNGVLRFQENKLKHASPQQSSVTEARLERIEQAVDSIAIEVERISEGQRFTTKLLSERATSER